MHGHGLLTLEESRAILNLHRKFIFLIKDCCRVNLVGNPSLSAALATSEYGRRCDGSQDCLVPGHPNMCRAVSQPSPAELQRLYRACWRWQIYGKLFGWTDGVESFDQEGQTEDQQLDSSQREHFEDEIAEVFLSIFPIHEVEELACLHVYAVNYYMKESRYARPSFVQSLITSGPEYLYEVQTATSEQRFHALLTERCCVNATSLRNALDAYEREVALGNWSWKGQNEVSNADRRPTVGWSWASSRGMQNTDFRLRRWGYVFWDDSRLIDEWSITKEQMLDWSLNSDHWDSFMALRGKW